MESYDVVVLGGGSGSQVATAAAGEGYEAAVLEPGPLGGACITRGCVPSKALIHRADLIEEIRRADRFGIDAAVHDVAYAEITSSIHDMVYEKADRQAESLQEADRVTLYESAGRFVDEREIELEGGDADGDRIRGDQVVIAVGGRPTIPPIDGLDEVDYLTSDDALYLDERPDELVIVGGGYIAAELGHFFAAVGADVSIVGRSDQLVPRENADAANAVTRALGRRCEVCTGHEVEAVESDDGSVVVTATTVDERVGGVPADADDDRVEITADELLLATGRRPNTDELGLDETDVETDDAGHVLTDDRLATDAAGIWALGDVLAAQPYKHVADHEAEIVAANVLGTLDHEGPSNGEAPGDADAPGGGDASADGESSGNGESIDRSAIPHAIFTKPRVASVGYTAAELDEEGVDYDTASVPYEVAPLGLILDAEEAFVTVQAASDGEILGCHVVGPQAETLIHEVVIAMRHGTGTLADVAETVHVHPALNEVLLAAFDELSDRSFSTAPDWRDVAGH